MKIFFCFLSVASLCWSAWVGVSDAYSFSDACGDLSRYARHPWCVTETVAVVPIPPENIWSGWAWKIRGGTQYVSHAVPALLLSVLWAGAAVFGIQFLLSCVFRKEE